MRISKVPDLRSVIQTVIDKRKDRFKYPNDMVYKAYQYVEDKVASLPEFDTTSAGDDFATEFYIIQLMAKKEADIIISALTEFFESVEKPK